jgi:hypothetical protein
MRRGTPSEVEQFGMVDTRSGTAQVVVNDPQLRSYRIEADIQDFTDARYLNNEGVVVTCPNDPKSQCVISDPRPTAIEDSFAT